MPFVIGRLFLYGLMWGIATHVRRQPSLGETEQRNYFAIIKLNIIFAALGLALFDYCSKGYIWFSNIMQPTSFFYCFGVAPGDWLGLAIAKYLACSVFVFLSASVIFGVNCLLLHLSKIGQILQRAFPITLGCVVVHLSVAAYGCVAFYLHNTRH